MLPVQRCDATRLRKPKLTGRVRISVGYEASKTKQRRKPNEPSISNSPDDDNTELSSYEAALEELNEPRLQFLQVSQQSPHWSSGLPDKTIAVLQGTAEAFVNPKGAIEAHAKRKAAEKLAKSCPYLSRQADLEFLEAHDELVTRQTQGVAAMAKRTLRGRLGTLISASWRRGDRV